MSVGLVGKKPRGPQLMNADPPTLPYTHTQPCLHFLTSVSPPYDRASALEWGVGGGDVGGVAHEWKGTN